MYGGRVIDDFDRRVVNTYMDEYMGDFIFDTFQPFHFYHDDKVDYFIPSPPIEETNEQRSIDVKKPVQQGFYDFTFVYFFLSS